MACNLEALLLGRCRVCLNPHTVGCSFKLNPGSSRNSLVRSSRAEAAVLNSTGAWLALVMIMKVFGHFLTSAMFSILIALLYMRVMLDSKAILLTGHGP